jgi:hypothetical protein
MYFVHCWLAAALGLQGELDEASVAFKQAVEMRPDLVSQAVTFLRRASPVLVTLYERTVYVGLRRAGMPDIFGGSNERPVGWIGMPYVGSRS